MLCKTCGKKYSTVATWDFDGYCSMTCKQTGAEAAEAMKQLGFLKFFNVGSNNFPNITKAEVVNGKLVYQTNDLDGWSHEKSEDVAWLAVFDGDYAYIKTIMLESVYQSEYGRIHEDYRPSFRRFTTFKEAQRFENEQNESARKQYSN